MTKKKKAPAPKKEEIPFYGNELRTLTNATDFLKRQSRKKETEIQTAKKLKNENS